MKKKISKAKVVANLPAVIPDKLPETINPQMLIMRAIENKVSIEILNGLFDLQKRVNAEKAARAFREAMSGFQAECPVIVKSAGVNFLSKKGGRVKYQYAPLDVIISQVKEIFSKYGLSYDFTTPIQNKESITATCNAHHILGHTESSSFSVPIDLEASMNPMQQVASALTYAKRYAFCNAFGILTGDEDNDAHSIDNGDPLEVHQETAIEDLKKFFDDIGKFQEEKVKKDAAIKEAADKIAALPDDIKQGFKFLGYTGNLVFAFCNKFGWDAAKIKIEVNKIIDMKNGGTK